MTAFIYKSCFIQSDDPRLEEIRNFKLSILIIYIFIESDSSAYGSLA
jgi:hypothetical protein